jgi:hypothetical protein
MTRRLVAAAAAVLALAACSGGSSDRAAYVDAASAGLLAETPTAPADDIRCVAQAIVEGIGVDRLRRAGVSVGELRNPEFEPPATIATSMDTAARIELATRLQSCGIGRIVGSDVALQFARTKRADSDIRQADAECLARGFDGAEARRMIAGMMLGDLTIPDAERLARLTVECVGLARIIANDGGLRLTDAETECIDRAGRSDTTFVKALADRFRDVAPVATSAAERVGVRVVACLTPAHRRAVARS